MGSTIVLLGPAGAGAAGLGTGPSTDAPAPAARVDRLYAANPNPFNARTVLRFDLAEPGSVDLAIFDAQGGWLGEWGSYGIGPGEFIYPTDIAFRVDDSGAIDRIYVSEYGGNEQAESPECTPACSICCMMLPISTSSPSQMASTSTSTAPER